MRNIALSLLGSVLATAAAQAQQFPLDDSGRVTQDVLREALSSGDRTLALDAEELFGGELEDLNRRGGSATVDVEISPDGETFASIGEISGTTAVILNHVDVSKGKPAAILLGDMTVNMMRWADDDYLILQATTAPETVRTINGQQDIEFERWTIISRETAKASMLSVNEGGTEYGYVFESSGALLSTSPQSKGKAIFASPELRISRTDASRLGPENDEIMLSVFETTLKNARKQRKVQGNEHTVAWTVNAAGDAIIRSDWRRGSGDYQIYTRPSGKGGFNLAQTFKRERGEPAPIVFFGQIEGTNSVQAWVRKDDGANDLVAFDMTSGALGASLIEDASINPTSWSYDEGQTAADAVTYEKDGVTQFYYLDESHRRMQSALESAIGGVPVAITSQSDNGERFIIRALHAGKPDDFYFFDNKAKQLELVAREPVQNAASN